MGTSESTEQVRTPWASCRSSFVQLTEHAASNISKAPEACIVQGESQKRRGRPRSSVFVCFSRIEDENGVFLGNKCRFCSFTSRDKSENPTYLSRHIRTRCSAPDHVKRALSTRSPSLASPLPISSSPTYQNVFETYRNFQAASPMDHSGLHVGMLARHARLHEKQTMTSNATSNLMLRTSSRCQLSHSGDGNVAVSKRGSTKLLRSGVEKTPHQPHSRNKRISRIVARTNGTERNSFLSPNPRIQESPKLVTPRRLSPIDGAIQGPLALSDGKYLGKSVSRTSSCFNSIPELRRPSWDGRGPLKPQPIDRISSVLRFLLARHISFSSVEGPLFEQVHVCSIKVSENARKEVGTPKSPNVLGRSSLPSGNELQECLTNSARLEIINGFSSQTTPDVASIHLIICFANTENPTHSNPNGRSSCIKYESHIASYFFLGLGKQLSYIGSRNVGGSPLSKCLPGIIDEAENQVAVQVCHTLLSRPTGGGMQTSLEDVLSPCVTLDVCQEVDVLCRDLLNTDPVLARVHRCTRLIASFFLELDQESTGRELFSGSFSEKDLFRSYISFASGSSSNSEHFWYSCYAVQFAIHTCRLVQVTQNGQTCEHHIRGVHCFLTSLSDEKCGNIPLCREVVRLFMSPAYLEDLQWFITLLKPLTNLISMYGKNDALLHCSSYSLPHHCATLPHILKSRSIGYVLHDCTKVFSEISVHIKQNDKDFQTLRAHVFARLFTQQPDGLPPIVNNVCCLAAILNPAVDVDTSFFPRKEVLSRALRSLRRDSQSQIALERGLFQFQKCKGEGQGMNSEKKFSGTTPHGSFSDNENADPLVWWMKHGNQVPELYNIALRVLGIPATCLSVIRFITNINAKCDDLRGHSRDPLREKRRFISWNLKLRKTDHLGINTGYT